MHPGKELTASLKEIAALKAERDERAAAAKTDHLRVETALRGSEERFRELAENINEVFWITDPLKLEILYLSPAYERIWGRSRESLYLAPETCLDAVHPEDVERVQRAEEDRRVTGTYDEEYRIVRLDGSIRWIRNRAFPVRNAAGELSRIVGVAEDVTERKHAELELRTVEQQLRALVGRLHTVREEEARRIARELHDDLGQELTALNMELADLGIKLPNATAKQREQIARMHAIVNHTVEVVQNIASELRLGQLDVLGLTAAIEWHVMEFSERSSIPCRVTRLDEVVNMSDVQKTAVFRILQEALTNIVRHAVATEVEISLHAEAHQVVLRVSDNGRGITSAELNRENAIGLLGIRERAQMVGAVVTITGIPGKGTIITVTVPLKPTAPPST
ncbi:MAG: PAS domain-containing protein [Verrucomicrobiota bacterium]